MFKIGKVNTKVSNKRKIWYADLLKSKIKIGYIGGYTNSDNINFTINEEYKSIFNKAKGNKTDNEFGLELLSNNNINMSNYFSTPSDSIKLSKIKYNTDPESNIEWVIIVYNKDVKVGNIIKTNYIKFNIPDKIKTDLERLSNIAGMSVEEYIIKINGD